MAGAVTWVTVEPVTKLRADGSWQATATPGGPRRHFQTSLIPILPLPRLAHGLACRAVPPLVRKLVGTHVRNIARTMQGRVLPPG